MNLFKSSKKEVVLVTDEEVLIDGIIRDILTKEGTRVSMAPRSNKYFITNKDIELNILIDGAAELVKTANHKYKYGWKFRNVFIGHLINQVIDWIEKDRSEIELEIFQNEVNLLNDISKLVTKA